MGETFAAWETANPELAKKYADAQAGVVPDLDSMMAEFEVGSGVATRNAGAEVLQPIAESMPFYVSGSADLHGSKTVACEAGVTLPWYKFADKVQGVDSFGLSAPGDEVYEEKGMTVANLVELVKA